MWLNLLPFTIYLWQEHFQLEKWLRTSPGFYLSCCVIPLLSNGKTFWCNVCDQREVWNCSKLLLMTQYQFQKTFMLVSNICSDLLLNYIWVRFSKFLLACWQLKTPGIIIKTLRFQKTLILLTFLKLKIWWFFFQSLSIQKLNSW